LRAGPAGCAFCVWKPLLEAWLATAARSPPADWPGGATGREWRDRGL